MGVCSFLLGLASYLECPPVEKSEIDPVVSSFWFAFELILLLLLLLAVPPVHLPLPRGGPDDVVHAEDHLGGLGGRHKDLGKKRNNKFVICQQPPVSLPDKEGKKISSSVRSFFLSAHLALDGEGLGDAQLSHISHDSVGHIWKEKRNKIIDYLHLSIFTNNIICEWSQQAKTVVPCTWV